MMAKEPADRYQKTADLVHALEAIHTSLGESNTNLPQTTIVVTTSAVRPASAPSPGLETLGGTPRATDQTISQKRLDADASPATVVLVEPSRTQSGIIRKYLQAQGIEQIVAVSSGEEALRTVRPKPPCAVISALHLPDMTGVHLAQEIRADLKGAAPGFVLISSEAESSETGSLSKCGNAVVLQKPFTPEKLADALRLVLSQPQSTNSASSATRQRNQTRVLIVDDSTAARLHIRGVLTGLGLSQFVEALDGAQAVAAVARETFDLIVTDYNMPFMDGRGLVGYLKQTPATASVPIIMVTTETDPAKLNEVRQLGVAAVCDKGFRPEVVGKIIDQLLGIR